MRRPDSTWMQSIGRWSALLGGIWGVGVTFALLFLPVVQYCQSIITSAGQQFNGCLNKTLIESQGGRLEPITWIYLAAMLALSLIAVAVALRAKGRARSFLLLFVGILLGIGGVIAGFSIGVFYLPAALLVLLGSVITFTG